MAQRRTGTAAPTLSIVIPAHNSERWIAGTIENVSAAVSKSRWQCLEVIVVDDGSLDKTAAAAKAAKTSIPVTVIHQKNKGRFLARKSGINKARGQYLLLLDSRIITSPGSLAYVERQLAHNPKAIVWNGHILMDRQGNPFARFWYVITFIAWRRYMKHPRLVHYGVDEFDYYPKGTTGFLCDHQLLLEAYSHFKTGYADMKFANDDTSLIHYIAEKSDIYMSPEYSFTYISRSTLRAFIPHTTHRGIVFIDGHFHRGSRYFLACWLYLILVPVFIVLLFFQPAIVLVPLLLLPVIFIAAKSLGAETADAAALAYVMPVFALFYTFGLYKGLYLKLKAASA